MEALNLISSHQPDIGKIYLYAKDSYEAKYPFLIKNWESTGLKHLNDSKTFIEYSNYMDGIYENIEVYDQIWYDFSNILSNKKSNPKVTELFINGTKLNIFILFITQSYFAVLKNIILDSTNYFIMKIPNKHEL